jgi:branched-chain amino acid aminotransferase
MEVFLNDRFVEAENAMLPVQDLAIQRGYGVFDFFRLQEGVLLYVEDHLARFENSASLLRLPLPYPPETIENIIRELTKRNGLKNAGIRLVLTGGYSPDAWQIGPPAFLIMQGDLHIDTNPTAPKAIRIITHDFVRDIPESKTINYTMGVWLQQKMKELEADDVLYHHHGQVTELPRCNFFIVNQDGLVVTPHRRILHGITRKRLLEIDGVYEGPVTVSDIRNAREAFLTSSTKRIQSITEIDGMRIGKGKPGPVACTLLEELLLKERNYIRAHG